MELFHFNVLYKRGRIHSFTDISESEYRRTFNPWKKWANSGKYLRIQTKSMLHWHKNSIYQMTWTTDYLKSLIIWRGKNKLTESALIHKIVFCLVFNFLTGFLISKLNRCSVQNKKSWNTDWPKNELTERKVCKPVSANWLLATFYNHNCYFSLNVQSSHKNHINSNINDFTYLLLFIISYIMETHYVL